MKAHIPTKQEIEAKLELDEILRLNKLWIYTIGRCVRISKERLRDLYANVCQMAGDIYEDPELWIRVDEYILGELKLTEGFEPEDYNEREWVAEQKHKEHHKKWRIDK